MGAPMQSPILLFLDTTALPACLLLLSAGKHLCIPASVVEGELDISGIGEMAREPYFWRLLWFTTWQALASTLLTLALGFAAGLRFFALRVPG
jgi:ABC-type Fe3+ transport system permease subunit